MDHKHLKSYLSFIKEAVQSKILYHGSPYRFESFIPKTTFFSDDKQFAIDYSEQKSFEGAMDSEPNLYTVEVNGNIFDANNPKELNELSKHLPSKISYTYNNFGFSGEVDKKEFLLNLKGYDIIEPIEDINTLEIGDTFPDPNYPVEDFLVVKKDNEHIYTLDQKNLDREIEKVLSKDKRIKEIVEPFAVSNEGRKYVPEHLYKAYITTFDKGGDWLGKPSKEELERFNNVRTSIKEEVIENRIERKYTKKFVLKPTEIELDDTWRFYENDTVQKAIKKLGYDGYVALESKKKTYAIFDPSKTVEVKSYEFPLGSKFTSLDQRKRYLEFDKKIYDMIKDKENYMKISLHMDRFDIYRAFINNETPEQFLQSFLDKNKL